MRERCPLFRPAIRMGKGLPGVSGIGGGDCTPTGGSKRIDLKESRYGRDEWAMTCMKIHFCKLISFNDFQRNPSRVT